AEPQDLARALPSFTGINRRMTWRGRGRGVDIVDDYAHHPTEIRVTLEALRRSYQPKRVLVVFQPHQHARTRHLFEDFATSFSGADEVIVPDIYGAREEGVEVGGMGSRELASRICEHGVSARYLPTLGAATDRLVQHAVEGDLIVTMGAGDVWKVADELVNRVC
ncbi:MAG: UDP-N-acetylmuramate--L-alanine ligase, partial [Planctomycetes bacterium]|nr:UDP-N-acetylmuramate--L-alanine ligase [Planctomycetota bacterium]